MKKQLTLITLLLTTLFHLQAQVGIPGGIPGNFQRGSTPGITGKISGVLLDSTANTPVEFATVVLINPQTGKQLDGGITDAKGAFKLGEVRLGTYELHFSFLGYRNKVLKGVELTPNKPDFDAGRVFIAPEGVTLTEVQVTSQAAVVENRIDKIVYNAEKDVTSVGGDASDLLQKVPLLSVDAQGNVSLRGSSNVQILINGKPSTIFSTNPADALKTIPADQIKSVEVITAPTAKFDGEGSGGIINIITKKKSVEGFTGSLSATAGNRQNRGNLNLSYSKGRFGLNLGGNGWYNPNRPSSTTFLRVDRINDTERILDQSGGGDSEFFGPRATLGMFYDINAYNSITSSAGFRGFGRSQDNLINARFNDPFFGLDQRYQRFSESRSLRSGFDWNVDYRRTFKKPEQEFSLGFQVDMDFSSSRNAFDQTDLIGNASALNIRNVNENFGQNAEITFQADYVHPISKKIKMETGAKMVIRDINSDFSADNFDFNANQFVRNPSATDIFYYDQDVMAGYVSFNTKLNDKTGLIVGGRYEYTAIAGDFKNVEANFTNSYSNFLPNLIISRNLSPLSLLKFSYNKRIQRPSLRFVNPFVDVSDPRDVSFGNPQLDPELTHQMELNYGTFYKGVVVSTSVFYRYTTDIIESFLQVSEDGVSQNTFRNIGENHSVGFNIFSSATIKKILTLRGGTNITSYTSQGTINGQRLSRSAWIWSANLNATLALKNGFKFETFGFYNSPRQTLQGSLASFSLISFGLLKEFNKKLTLGLNASQPFARDIRFENELSGVNFSQRSVNAVAIRSFGVTVNYRFGKLDFRQQQRARRGQRNNDLKEDGGTGETGGIR